MPTSRTYLFFVPDPGTAVSGGHLYNEQLVQALRLLGREVVVAELEAAPATLAAHPEAYAIFDSVYLNGPDRDALAALPLEGPTSIFLAHHLHSLFPEDGRTATAIFATDERPVLERFAALWATSPFAGEYLQSQGLNQPVLTVEPGLERIVPTSPTSGEPPRALVVANLVRRKGVLALLEHLASAGDTLPAFELRILGGPLEPDYAEACHRLVRDSDALRARVTFAGTLAPAAIPDELAAADVFVSAAAMETYGMAILEARATGLPLRILRGGFTERHLSNGHGSVFDTVGELTAALCQLLADRDALREEKRAALAARGAQRTWSDAARELVAQLEG